MPRRRVRISLVLILLAQSVALAACMNILGAFVSTEVAKTIGEGVVSPAAVTHTVVIAALLTAFLWNAILTRMGMPISCSHALIGALMGASVAYGGIDILNFEGLKKIFNLENINYGLKKSNEILSKSISKRKRKDKKKQYNRKRKGEL